MSSKCVLLSVVTGRSVATRLRRRAASKRRATSWTPTSTGRRDENPFAGGGMSPLSDHQRGYFQAHRVGTVYLTAGQAPDDAIRSTAASMLRGYELDGEPRPAV